MRTFAGVCEITFLSYILFGEAIFLLWLNLFEIFDIHFNLSHTVPHFGGCGSTLNCTNHHLDQLVNLTTEWNNNLDIHILNTEIETEIIRNKSNHNIIIINGLEWWPMIQNGWSMQLQPWIYNPAFFFHFQLNQKLWKKLYFYFDNSQLYFRILAISGMNHNSIIGAHVRMILKRAKIVLRFFFLSVRVIYFP